MGSWKTIPTSLPRTLQNVASSTSVNWIGGHSGEDGSQYTAGWVDAGGYEGWIPALEAIECELMEALS